MIRFFDLIISLSLILILFPFFVVIGAIVKISSKGPIFFLQKRVGLNNIDFTLFKFRTMYLDSDKTSLLTIGGKDKRITAIGYFLRNYKIDELPQLLNVLIGQMSLVGPRPEVRKYVDMYNEYQKEVLSIKPGITDWASIIFRNENELLEKSPNPELHYIDIILPQKIQLNNIYVKRKNIIEYFKILFTTILKIIFPNFQPMIKK
jgi:lipopolysaccharide/colanic/teichoic acid biosynthesis glycosyltransferase